jgi:hypothetical protein
MQSLVAFRAVFSLVLYFDRSNNATAMRSTKKIEEYRAAFSCPKQHDNSGILETEIAFL